MKSKSKYKLRFTIYDLRIVDKIFPNEMKLTIHPQKTTVGLDIIF